MSLVGAALLPLHPGKAPRWLFGRMVKLAGCIVRIIVDEYGRDGLMRRLSDPWFFQSLSCVLGYDWHSSGTTTVTCGALKEAIDPDELGIAVAGGKGRASRRAPQEIDECGTHLGLTGSRIDRLIYCSRMAAKVDGSLIQDGYQIYHHSFFFDEAGDWMVIQQGINEEAGNARRYHWSPEHGSLVEEPHEAILCDTRLEFVLDMTSVRSDANRRASVDLARERPERIRRMMLKPLPRPQTRLDGWAENRNAARALVMPWTVDWDTLKGVYEFQPRDYEELLSLKGVGPATVRGLSLVAELVYGERASWSDPVRFSFAFGGKDGVPFPVDRGAMDEAVDVLRTGVASSGVRDEEKRRALGRLRACVPPIPGFRF
jgi:hypothetical protein